MKDKSRFWFYLNYSLQICQHLNIFTAFDLKKKQKAEKFSKGHLDDWITGIFPSCARERSRDGFRHFSEKIHCQAFVEGWVAVIWGRCGMIFSFGQVASKLMIFVVIYFFPWFSHFASRSRNVQSWPLTSFGDFFLQHREARQQQQHLQIGLRWKISCIQNISLRNAPPPKLNETDKRHLWIEKDVHFINLGATYSKFLCSKMSGLLKNLFWEKPHLCLHIFPLKEKSPDFVRNVSIRKEYLNQTCWAPSLKKS